MRICKTCQFSQTAEMLKEQLSSNGNCWWATDGCIMCALDDKRLQLLPSDYLDNQGNCLRCGTSHNKRPLVLVDLKEVLAE